MIFNQIIIGKPVKNLEIILTISDEAKKDDWLKNESFERAREVAKILTKKCHINSDGFLYPQTVSEIDCLKANLEVLSNHESLEDAYLVLVQGIFINYESELILHSGDNKMSLNISKRGLYFPEIKKHYDKIGYNKIIFLEEIKRLEEEFKRESIYKKILNRK